MIGHWYVPLFVDAPFVDVGGGGGGISNAAAFRVPVEPRRRSLDDGDLLVIITAFLHLIGTP